MERMLKLINGCIVAIDGREANNYTSFVLAHNSVW